MICSKEKCVGCYSCINICPMRCIQMQEDIYGNIYPVIDESKCIGCKLCEKSCPANANIMESVPKKCFAGWAINDLDRKTSSSGGVASVITEYIVKNKGVVYGAVIDPKKLTVEHRRIDTEQEISKLKKSKYVHSYIKDCYRQAEEDLNNGKKVLFTGTPCQIGGLKAFLKKDYNNLYTIDIICHGVPNQKYLLEYVKSFGEIEDFDDYSFRDNSEYTFTLYNRGEVKKKIYYRESEYIMGFLTNLIQRENCFSCKYAKVERVSDITLGDFWGIGKKEKFSYDTKNGVSVVLVNSSKGENLLNECEERLFLEQRQVVEAIDGNTQLRTTIERNNKMERFLKEYSKLGLKRTINKLLYKDFLKYKIRKKVRGY